MVGFYINQSWNFLITQWKSVRTSRMKVATCGGMKWRGDIALQYDFFPLEKRVRDW